MTTQKIDKYSALINQGFLENKLKMIPTSIKETYSDLVSKKPVLLTRELIADDKVVLGVEYSAEGEAVNAYTTDKTGRHITIARVEEMDNTKDSSVRDMIADHLKKMSVMKNNERPVAKTKPQAEKKKVVIREAPTIKKEQTRV